MVTIYLGMGSNLGDRLANLRAAYARLAESGNFHAISCSGVYETRPAGGPSGQSNYLNAAVQCGTCMTPHQVLACCKSMEVKLGRTTGERWGPRVIDLDLLLYSNRVIESRNLIVPHRSLHQRPFALRPLAELCPRFTHPRIGRTIEMILMDLGDDDSVVRRMGAASLLSEGDNTADAGRTGGGQRGECGPKRGPRATRPTQPGRSDDRKAWRERVSDSVDGFGTAEY